MNTRTILVILLLVVVFVLCHFLAHYVGMTPHDLFVTVALAVLLFLALT